MLFRWIFLFGSRREQPKARRSKETVKPRLEELTERILLSATATPSPQTAEAVMQMVATMMEERVQLLVTVEHNLENLFDTYTQRIAQDVSAGVQQWKQLLGIAPPASGSGSGSGTITPIHNPPTQQPIPIKPLTGSGTGSGATTSHESPSRSELTPLTGSGSGSIPEVYFGSGSNPFPEASGSCGSVVATRTPILSGPTSHDVTVYYETVDGTAIAGTDYTESIGSVTIPAGQVTPDQPIKITILDDGNDESGGTQYFDVELTGAQGATLGTPYISEVDITEGLQQQPTDTLVWNPCPDDPDDASIVTNWYDQTQGFQLQKGALGPNPSSPIIFDGTPDSQTPDDDSPIDWDDPQLPSMTLENGYTKQQTINPGDTIELTGPAGTSLSMDGTSWLNLDFGDSKSIFQIDNNATITNMNLAGNDRNANFYIRGGTTTIGQSANPQYQDNIGVQFTVGSGATLNDLSNNPLTFTSNNLTLWDNGNVTFWGSGSSNTLIQGQNPAISGCDIRVSGGTLTYNGQGQVTRTIAVPILVSNGGTFVDTAVNPTPGGLLIVKGADASTNNASVYVTGAGSSMQFSNYASLECDNDYYQDGGVLKTMDSTNPTLVDGVTSQGTATIAGSATLVIDLQGSGSGYGKFTVDGNLNFSGTYNPMIAGNTPETCDTLYVDKSMNIQNGSYLLVAANGQLVPGQWTIIYSGGNNLNKFSGNNDNATGLHDTNNQPTPGEYQVSF